MRLFRHPFELAGPGSPPCSSLTLLAAPARAQRAPETSSEHDPKATPVVRTFGAAGGYRTEVRSETKGTLGPEDRRQVSLLAAVVFQHVEQARRALEADDTGRGARRSRRAGRRPGPPAPCCPVTVVRTRTTAPDGKVIYDDEGEVRDDRVALFEGMLHARTLAPIQAARNDADRIAGVRVVESETISTEAVADLDLVDAQLGKAAKALDDKKPEAAARALHAAQTRGVDFHYRKEDTPLAEARDAIWLAKRALEENNAAQAQANLSVARQQLEIYRQVSPEDRRIDVNQMMAEVNKLDAQLRHEASQPGGHSQRSEQGGVMTRWWDQLNGWFKKRP